MIRNITMKGSPLTLVGRTLKIGDAAPDFNVTAQDFTAKSLADFQDKIKILTSFPSIDTPVCDLQIKEFNKKAALLSSDVLIIGISKDLPFAQKRFCEAFDIKNVLLFSDYKNSSFGLNYGLLIEELNLLARSVIILDKKNIIKYIQIVPELAMQPDYKEALIQLEKIVQEQ
ncbi:MAG: thiol peroxidase [Candidatus Omnitrophica bacterium]|nr:thiol peroxidase [Candidatus Omnitrophota bacterium]